MHKKGKVTHFSSVTVFKSDTSQGFVGKGLICTVQEDYKLAQDFWMVIRQHAIKVLKICHITRSFCF